MYIIVAGSAAGILLEIDKFMIPQIEQIAQVAYYSVGIYIASIVAIPTRAMQQITSPITAKEMNSNNIVEVILDGSGCLWSLLIQWGNYRDFFIVVRRLRSRLNEPISRNPKRNISSEFKRLTQCVDFRVGTYGKDSVKGHPQIVIFAQMNDPVGLPI